MSATLPRHPQRVILGKWETRCDGPELMMSLQSEILTYCDLHDLWNFVSPYTIMINDYNALAVTRKTDQLYYFLNNNNCFKKLYEEIDQTTNSPTARSRCSYKLS